MICTECGTEIPMERLEILPDTKTCVKCSSVKPYTEDTAGIIDGADMRDMLASAQSTTKSDRW